ncbi:MAG: TraX family protein [Clostridia bacterium]
MAGTGARSIKLNTDTGFLKIIAILTMFCDHIGAAFFPQLPILRAIGRISFPLFAYCIAVGCVYTKNAGRYALRILLLALISQPIYCFALSHASPAMRAIEAQSFTLANALTWYALSLQYANILFTLLLGILMITSIKKQKYLVTAVLTLGVWYLSSSINYGWRGVALMLLFYAFLDRPAASVVWVAGFMAWWGLAGGGSYHFMGVRFSSQLFALLALPLIYLPTRTNIKLPKWLFYLVYPAHLAVIYGVSQLLAK